jgi:hypothetical protein
LSLLSLYITTDVVVVDDDDNDDNCDGSGSGDDDERRNCKSFLYSIDGFFMKSSRVKK